MEVSMGASPARWLCLVLWATTASAETTRTLRAELSASPSMAFAVENLAGTMRVVPAAVDNVVATATVHAENEALANAVRFEQIAGTKGVPTLRVRYPFEKTTSLRYPRAPESGFLGLGVDSFDYDGAHVRVSSARGTLLYADVEVQVPKRSIQATFVNHVGDLSAQDIEGRTRFDTDSGAVTLQHIRGETVADTGSGNVKATQLEGSFACDTGSGDCGLLDFQGERLKLDTGSGEIRVSSARATSVNVDTGSGSVHLVDIDAEEIHGDTGSGNVDVESRSQRLRSIKASTGSGDVALRLGPDAGFDAQASLSSGDLVNHYADARPVTRGGEVIGYRRGDGRIQIKVDTGSGDLILEPGRR
jgi:hypothetical protein